MGPLRLSVRLMKNESPAPLYRSLNSTALRVERHWLSTAHESFAPYSLANRPASPAYARPSISGDGSFTPPLCPRAPSVPNARKSPDVAYAAESRKDAREDER
jgi:hypothetical protein